VSGDVLPAGDNFCSLYGLLLMDEEGRFLRRDSASALTPVLPHELPDHLDRRIVLPPRVTDVFIWVHGWRTDRAAAIVNAKRMFNGIEVVHKKRTGAYPNLADFVPGFVAVSWPSDSRPNTSGYKTIRDRAWAMTEDGYAEFFLASLLGYLKPTDPEAGGVLPRTLRSERGFCVHCLGHSFGGRFLTAAIGAAANPRSKKTLSLLQSVTKPKRKVLSGSSDSGGFSFEVDSAVIFQMAAPNVNFGQQLRTVVSKGPLRGPFVTTFSGYDTANCTWHSFMEQGQQGIGCRGAFEPKELLKEVMLRTPDMTYDSTDFPARTIVNVDANRLYAQYDPLQIEGAHSDFWYDDSIHLILSVANAVRVR
jgi:hypothetical protein